MSVLEYEQVCGNMSGLWERVRVYGVLTSVLEYARVYGSTNGMQPP